MNTVFLYVIFAGHFEQRVQFPTWRDCFAALHEARHEIPDGDENETGLVMFCGTGRTDFHGVDGRWVQAERVTP